MNTKMVDDEQRARLARLAAEASEPDTSDIAEAPAGAWASATGHFYRPQPDVVRIDPEILDWFRSAPGDYQDAINTALRQHMARSRSR